MTPSMALCQLNLDCTSMEATIEHVKSQNLSGFAEYRIADKEQLNQLVCRLETIATHLRNLT
jgi:hypothetical protein